MNESLTKLLDHLHRGGQFAHWWTPDSGKFYTDKKTGEQKQAKFSAWFPVGRRSAIPAAWRDKNVYFCVHPQSAIPQKERDDGNVTDQKYVKAWVSLVAAVNCFFAEYDVKDYGSKEAISAHLRTLPLYPSVFIDSGGGFHCYWLLANTVTVTDDNRNHIKRLQYAWVKLVGSDDDAKDLARVLRVPGTLNRKEKYAPDYPTVAIVEADYGRLYSMEEFERLTEHLRQEKPRTPYAGSHSVTDDLVTAAENLKRLSPSRRDRYQEWMNVGFALKGLGNAGLQLWDEWSRGSSNYTEGCCDAKWDRMSDTGLGLGSLVKWANDDDPVGKRSYTNGTNGHAPYTNGHGKPVTPAEQTPEPTPEPVVDAPEGKLQPALNAIHYRAEDGGIMDAWLDHYGDEWIFVVGPDKWHHWNNTHWAEDKALSIRRQIVDLLDLMNRQCSENMKTAPEKIKQISAKYAAAGLDIPDAALHEIERIKTEAGIAKAMHMATKRSSARLSSVEAMSRPKRGVAVDRMNIDDALNLANGVLSLKSLELRPHDRSDMFTYCLDYEFDPDADCPLFKKYLSEVLVLEGTTQTDESLVMMFQELLGYSLTPDTKHEVMVWMFGEGGNGKSVAISIVEALLGPMSMSIDFQSIGLPGNYDLADIPGKRVLLSTEAERNKSMAEGYIKKIVTGDTINTRPIYGSPISFKSTAKIWWAMNDKPIIKDTTDSMWRRMKLIPFYRKFEEGKNADVDLPNKLRAELPGILNWAIDGLLRLTLNGRFTRSAASEDAKQQYREEANPVAQWVNTMTVRTSYPATLQGALFKEYTHWCQEQNERAITSTQFGKDLKRLRIECERKTAGFMYNLALVSTH